MNHQQVLQKRFRRVLITGGRTGLGRVLADGLRADGLQVYGTSRQPPAGEDWLLEADFSEPHGCRRFWQDNELLLQEVDLWIFNAGAGAFGVFPDQGEAVITRQWQLLLNSPVQLLRLAWPGLQERPESAVVFVSSLAGKMPIPGMSIYNSAKAGLSQFAASLMVENGNGLPQIIDWQLGDIRTDFNDHFLADITPDDRSRQLRDRLDEIIRSAPPPQTLLGSLEKALRSGHSGVVCSGSFFQARLAERVGRWLAGPLMRRWIRRYYRW